MRSGSHSKGWGCFLEVLHWPACQLLGPSPLFGPKKVTLLQMSQERNPSPHSSAVSNQQLAIKGWLWLIKGCTLLYLNSCHPRCWNPVNSSTRAYLHSQSFIVKNPPPVSVSFPLLPFIIHARASSPGAGINNYNSDAHVFLHGGVSCVWFRHRGPPLLDKKKPKL